MCCHSCLSFSDCTHYSWVQDVTSSFYQQCFIKKIILDNVKKSVNNSYISGKRIPVIPPPPSCAMEDNVDFNNNNLYTFNQVLSANDCCNKCKYFNGCYSWSWVKDPYSLLFQSCTFKGKPRNKIANNRTISGVVITNPPIPPKRTGKRNLAWFLSKSCSDLRLMRSITKIYSWTLGPWPFPEMMPCFAELGIEFVAMAWGPGSIDLIQDQLYINSKYLLGFNEPNFKTSLAYIIPSQAAKLWPIMEKYADQYGMKLGSPCPAPCFPPSECYAGSVDPTVWLDEFLGNCSNCRIDFLTTHKYACNITDLMDHFKLYKKYNKPVWLTEFSCPEGPPERNRTVQTEIGYLKNALYYLDNEPMVEQYFWFGTRVTKEFGENIGSIVSLLESNSSSLTELGRIYNGVAVQ
jgi:hypothetical protein